MKGKSKKLSHLKSAESFFSNVKGVVIFSIFIANARVWKLYSDLFAPLRESLKNLMG
jgi:hypothetical protein